MHGNGFFSPNDSARFELLLMLLSRFSHVRLCVTPWTAAHQAPPSLGFSRQKHWSGLPFPSPMHQSEKWKMKVKSLSHVQLFATPWTAAYRATPFTGFSRQEYWSGVPLPSSTPVLKLRTETSKWKWKSWFAQTFIYHQVLTFWYHIKHLGFSSFYFFYLFFFLALFKINHFNVHNMLSPMSVAIGTRLIFYFILISSAILFLFC